MGKDARSDPFYRAAEARIKILKDKFEKFMDAMSGASYPDKASACQACLTELNNVLSMLAPIDYPPWANQLREVLGNLASSAKGGTIYSGTNQTVADFYMRFKNTDWSYLAADRDEDEDVVDFDAIYRKYHEESAIPKLFDEMVAKLEDILGSGLIEFISAERAIANLIVILKKNARGSYPAANQSRQFVNEFVAGGFWGMLKQVPALGPWVESFEKTSKKLNIDWPVIIGDIRAKMRAEIAAEIPQFNPRGLPVTMIKSIEDHVAANNVIDVEIFDIDPEGMRQLES